MRTEGQLTAVPDDSALDGSSIGRLAASAHEIASIGEPDELVAAIPELARALCRATAAALLRVNARGAVELLCSAGAFQAQPDRLAAMARSVIDSQAQGRRGDPFCTNGTRRLAVLPLDRLNREPVLAVERKPPGECLSETEVDQLAVYALVAGGAFARAHATAVLREAAPMTPSRTAPSLAPSRAGSSTRYTFRDFVGGHPRLLQVLEDAQRAARLDVSILITGESGTGKELLAQAIHRASPRASARFVAINVMAIPRELLESELFGYEGGAFTGARSSGRTGSFGEAGRGTLLLDEIGDMPLELQGKLLRVLQERVVQRLGGSREVPVLARVIATTNCDLEQAVRAGRFRLDLYHRLRVVHLQLPALRERRGDVRLLIERHLALHAERSRRPAVTMAPAVLAAMEAYDWPGNVRELLNVIEGELALLPAGKSSLSVVPGALRRTAIAGSGPAESDTVPLLSEIVRKACREAVAQQGGNLTSAARALGISKNTLYRKLRSASGPASEVADPGPKPEHDPQR